MKTASKAFLLLLPSLWLQPAAAVGAPGDLIERLPFPVIAPQDIAWDPVSKSYFASTFLSGTVIRLGENLREKLGEFPSPFSAGEAVTGIAYDSIDDTLWVIQPQLREIAEIRKDGTPTGRSIAPPFEPVVNPGADPTPRGMAFDPSGDFGRGTLYIVESLGTVIYEVNLAGDIVRSFVHPDDPDGFPGKGASARASDIQPIHDLSGSLSGFYITGFDFKTGTAWIRRLDAQGRYTGFSIQIENAGGTVSGFVVKDHRRPDGTSAPKAIIAVVESRAEIAVLEGTEPPHSEIFNYTCAEGDRSVQLAWANLEQYDAVEVLRDCRVIAVLDGRAIEHIDRDLGDGVFIYRVRGRKGDFVTETGDCVAVLGPGQVLRQALFQGRVGVDLAVDDQGSLLVADFSDRSVHIYGADLVLAQVIPGPFQEEKDRLTGVAFRPGAGTIFVYNPETNQVGEIDFGGALKSSFVAALPNRPDDPADKALVIGMDFNPEGNAGDGTLWILENTRSMIHEIDLGGRVLRSFPHPDLLEVPVPAGSHLGPFTSGLAVVPGSGGHLLDLTGGTVHDRDSTRIFRVDAETGKPLPGMEIPLAGVDKAAPHIFACIAHVERNGAPVMAISTIVANQSKLVEVDARSYALRPITDLACRQEGFSDSIRLTFSNNDRYDRIEVHRDCARLADLAGDAAGYLDTGVPPGIRRYDVRGVRGGTSTRFETASVRSGPGAILERRFLEVLSPVQLAPEPAGGTFLVSSNTPDAARNLFRINERFEPVAVLEDAVPSPYQVAAMAARADPAGREEIHVIAWKVPVGFGEKQVFPLRVLDGSGTLLRETTIEPPRPSNGFIQYPTGLAWHRQSDTFFYLERNSSTLVRMSSQGRTLAEIPHPLPPAQSFVFNLGLATDPEGEGIFVTTAGPRDKRITTAVQLTTSGRLTGIAIPLDHLPLNPITGIAIRGFELVVIGSLGSTSEAMVLEAFDPVPAPADLQCRVAGDRAALSWRNAAAYESIGILRDGVEIARLPGGAQSFEDPETVWTGVRVYSVRGRLAGGEGRNVFCEIGRQKRTFIRGDADGNQAVEVTDAVFTLEYLFLGGPEPPCDDAADADDDGAIAITDPIRTLGSLFLGEGPLPPPHPLAGEDPTVDGLACS